MSFPQDCIAVPRTPAGQEICQLAAEVLGFAENLAHRMDNKLSPLAESAPPTVAEKNSIQRSMPPLFNEYRASLQAIKDQLYRMEDTLSRVDI